MAYTLGELKTGLKKRFKTSNIGVLIKILFNLLAFLSFKGSLIRGGSGYWQE